MKTHSNTKKDLERRLKRLIAQKEALEREHKGVENTKFTYWGGWSLGYLKGQIKTLEDILEV